MQVNHLQTNQNQNQQPDRNIPLRDGDVYRATIKERRDNQEAVISIRGREVVAKFEGEMPRGDRVNVQIESARDEIIRVRAVNDETRPVSSQGGQPRDAIAQTMRQLGVSNPSPELKEAAQSLMKRNVPLTREAVKELQRFMAEGNPDKRLETVRAMANKRLEVTSTHLRSVHEALHGRPLAHVMNDLAKEIDRDFRVEPREQVRRGAARQEETQVLRNTGAHERPASEQVRGAREAIRQESSVQRAISEVRQQVVNQPQIPRDIAQLVDRATTEAAHLDRVGRERLTEMVRDMNQQGSSVSKREVARNIQAILSQEPHPERSVEQIRTLLQQQGQGETRQAIERVLTQVQQLSQVGRDQILQALQRAEQQLVQQEVSPATSKGQAEPNTQQATLIGAVETAKKTLQNEANVERALRQIQTTIANQPQLPELMKQSFEQKIEQAQMRIDGGRELAARQIMTQALQQVDQAAKEIEPVQRRESAEARQYTQNEQFQTSVEMASKNIAVTTVTQKVAEATASFKQFQREISRTLDQVTRQIDQFKNQAQPVAKPLLETTIKKLDNAILRSEMMLLTDMKTERSLMQASGQLAEAKKLLARGHHQEANQIVREVKQLMERLNFQPSETKVKHYVQINERSAQDGRTPSQAFTQQYSETVRAPMPDSSPRAMFEMVRNMGLNRDSELALQLASGREQQNQESTERNMKSMLMQLAKSEEEGTRTNQLANQALNNVTGQQLLSRSDQQSNMQSLYFNLPLLLEEKVENLQVFVNSRNEGEKVDWENCSLFFLMDTPKMGEIGIAISASERQLSVTLKNDDDSFQTRMSPLVDQAVQKLAEIGYSIKGINYAKLNATPEETQGSTAAPKQTPTFTEKGFDFKI
ncbi:hypothetical protein [Bacillus sp. FJAT-45037]|uniref:hypothetical protein n=1 Tax=Bacillus sp. FJAT-45037 TaxID=2011007 RepID=UPI000C24535D|nr:hypothetical protein [Bacillus sp. FJAT-45037]